MIVGVVFLYFGQNVVVVVQPGVQLGKMLLHEKPVELLPFLRRQASPVTLPEKVDQSR